MPWQDRTAPDADRGLVAADHPGRRSCAGLRIAAALGGSGFIAAFLAGLLFGGLGRQPDEAFRFSENLGSLLDGLTFLAFGAVLLGPALSI